MIEHIKNMLLFLLSIFKIMYIYLKKTLPEQRMTIIFKKKTMSVSVLSLKSSIWIQVLLYRYRPSYIKQHPVSDTWVPSFAVVPGGSTFTFWDKIQDQNTPLLSVRNDCQEVRVWA